LAGRHWSLAKTRYYTLGCGKMGFMARKKKPKKFSAVKAVKELSRERIGKVPLARVVPDRKKKNARERRGTLKNLLTEE
jgi:hypothetical protein